MNRQVPAASNTYQVAMMHSQTHSQTHITRSKTETAALTAVNKRQETILESVENEDENIVEKIGNTFATHPKPFFVVDTHDNTFLHIAASKNNTELLNRFLSHEYSFMYNEPNADDDIPLYVAIRHGHKEAVQCLLNATFHQSNACCKDTLSRKNSKARTALHVAVLHHRDGDIVGLIVDAMIRAAADEINAIDVYHRTALHYAINLCSVRKCRKCNCVQRLSSSNPAKTTDGGVPALHLAAKLGDLEMLATVLRTFFHDGTEHDIDELCGDHRTALMICAENGDVDGFKLLLYSGASLGKVNKRGQNVLHLMVQETVGKKTKVKPILRIFEIIKHFLTLDDKYSLPLDVDRRTSTIGNKPSQTLIHLLTEQYAMSTMKGNDCDGGQDDGAVVGTLYNVAQLAAHLHASKMFEAILKCTNAVEKRRAGDFDITKKPTEKWCLKNIIPSQLELSNHPDNKCAKSYIEMIITTYGNENAKIFRKMAKIQPLKSLISKLSLARLVLGSLLLFVHVIYMSFFSVYVLQTLTAPPLPQPANGNHTRHSNSSPYWFSMFLVYPLLMLVRLITWAAIIICSHKRCDIRRDVDESERETTYARICRRFKQMVEAMEFTHETNYVVFELLSIVISSVFIAVIVVWFVQYLQYALRYDIEFETYARTVAVALAIGWLYVIELMRAVPAFQAFTSYAKLIFVKDIMRVVCLYAVVLTGFSLAVYVCLVMGSSPVETVIDAFFETHGTLYGMADLFGAVNSQTIYNDLGNSSRGMEALFFRGLLAMYMLTSYIILINVLVAMLNSSYEKVNEQTQVLWDYETTKTFVYLTKSTLFRRLLDDYIFKLPSGVLFWESSPVEFVEKGEEEVPRRG